MKVMVSALVGLLFFLCGPVSHERSRGVLYVHPALQNRLETLSGGLVKEVGLCVTGAMEGGLAVATNFTMPYHIRSSGFSLEVQRCDPTVTLAFWHNHPYMRIAMPFGCGPPVPTDACKEGARIRVAHDARRLCSMSPVDRQGASETPYPFYMISVTPRIHCYFTHAQAVADTTNILYSIDGQRSW